MIAICVGPLPAEQVAQLRLETAWEVIDPTALQRALDNSLFCLSAREDEQLVGMVRASGDGILYAHIQDLIVAQGHRGQGIAGRLLDAILHELDAQLVHGSAIGLMAVAGLEGFYASRGFTARPDGIYGAGMTRMRG
ncbi:Acetyltransferase (GNAT) domain-containing protein [Monaibacterium marinum]|uniref:Acetyltransferase (GNAT) domain-containing protein n=1 Tax=Pontivivens marinum TaxID=1690039 RepID=A0A2C9CVK0_9RHOB|nr:GNAT family N-acetyltransferase [Monaibacterium marinum]SOH95288.1 Acetyltransferase (GNAT) domain-containing protein [Monaibacterium marinum]